MLRALFACLTLTACSQTATTVPTPKYISIVVLKTNCGEFDAALLIGPDGKIRKEYDIGLAVAASKDIPEAQGLQVIDGPCRHTTL